MGVFALNLLVTFITLRFYRHGFWRVDYLPLASQENHFAEVGLQNNMTDSLLTKGKSDFERIHCYE